eukprot:COSAG03_NODE_2381_length_2824_cov_2.674128_5_plen_86_part_00
MAPVLFVGLLGLLVGGPPRNPTRVSAAFRWCDCGTGGGYITVIPDGRTAGAVNVTPFQPQPWLPWRARSIRWVCSGGVTAFEHRG